MITSIVTHTRFLIVGGLLLAILSWLSLPKRGGIGRLGLQSGIEDLVAHRRVSEAMVALFSELDKEIGTDKQDVDTKGEGSDRGLWIVLLVVGMGGAIFFVSQRVCPRCGRILRRRTRPSIGSYNEENVVYYCRHCSYTRTVNRKRGPRGRGG